MKMRVKITDKEVMHAAKEFGFSSKQDFVAQAVADKILELKKIKFFAISEKIRKGLLKRRIKPDKMLQRFKT